jgi:signal transduction histidine kinase/phage shock protein PspC (stress-responsive transcriptional regulator)
VVDFLNSCHADEVSEIVIKPPRAYRLVELGLVAGVAAGMSAHFKIPVWALRVGFLLACGWKLSGAIAYGFMWVLLSQQPKSLPLGLVVAEKQGQRIPTRVSSLRRVAGWCGSVLMVVAISWGIHLYDHSWFGQDVFVVCALGLGIAIVWITHEMEWFTWVKAISVVVGMLLAGGAASVLVTHRWAGCVHRDQCDVVVGVLADMWAVITSKLNQPYDLYDGYVFTSFAVGSALVVLTIALIPWFLHPRRTAEEKELELIQQTRAEFAAHLHDSVLQTLAVIQKQSTDGKAVAQLARRQEKDLRDWLYAEQVEEESAKSALKEVISELEAIYPVAVELVTVGDHEMTVEVDAVVRAAREAILNAAKHSQADKIDVYAEMKPECLEVYVRDRGRGFKVDDIGEDRLGIRRSIIDRVTRFGGLVNVRSTEGEGTEIYLSMPLKKEGQL